MVIKITYSIQERYGAFGDYFLHIESQEILEDVKKPSSSPSESRKDKIRLQKLQCNVFVDSS